MNEVSMNNGNQSNKAQKLSTPNAPPSADSILETARQDSISDDHIEIDPAQDSQDYFVLPSDFLQDVFPESDLHTSENFIAELNLDQYFSNEFTAVNFAPESQGLST